MLIGRGKEMESADDRFDRLVRKLLPREGENVHDARMAAAGDDDQPFRRIEDQPEPGLGWGPE